MAAQCSPQLLDQIKKIVLDLVLRQETKIVCA